MAKGFFVILSKKHMDNRQPVFWRPDAAGYTIFPWAAGIYTKEQVEADPGYYNDGFNSIAVELTNEGLEAVGFECRVDLNKLAEKEVPNDR